LGIPIARFGEIVAEVPAPLGIGNCNWKMAHGSKGFICENYAINDALDISHLGGWRAYIQSLQQNTSTSQVKRKSGEFLYDQ
jgi:allophanate hydrolase